MQHVQCARQLIGVGTHFASSVRSVHGTALAVGTPARRSQRSAIGARCGCARCGWYADSTSAAEIHIAADKATHRHSSRRLERRWRSPSHVLGSGCSARCLLICEISGRCHWPSVRRVVRHRARAGLAARPSLATSARRGTRKTGENEITEVSRARKSAQDDSQNDSRQRLARYRERRALDPPARPRAPPSVVASAEEARRARRAVAALAWPFAICGRLNTPPGRNRRSNFACTAPSVILW